jgi:hypothetical protein
MTSKEKPVTVEQLEEFSAQAATVIADEAFP